MNWDDLRIALSIAREGAVRQAARELGVSHSTVSRRLSELEASLGVRLFERLTEGYELTPAGQDVFDTGVQVEDLLAGLSRRIAGSDLRLTGSVRVTLPDNLLPLLAGVFRAFGSTYPAIELSLSVGTSFADLAHRQADVAIRIADDPPSELVGRRACDAALGVYASAAYVAAHGEHANLERHDWVGWDSDSTMMFARWMREHVPNARVVLRVNTSAAIKDAVDAGVGVGLFPCALGEVQPGWRRLKRLKEPTTPVWVLTHRDLRTTARVRVLRDFVFDALVRERALIEGRGADAKPSKPPRGAR